MVGDVPVGGNRKEAVMVWLAAKDIMFPRVSPYAKDKGSELVKKLLSNYPALPIVNDDLH